MHDLIRSPSARQRVEAWVEDELDRTADAYRDIHDRIDRMELVDAACSAQRLFDETGDPPSWVLEVVSSVVDRGRWDPLT